MFRDKSEKQMLEVKLQGGSNGSAFNFPAQSPQPNLEEKKENKKTNIFKIKKDVTKPS